jgi:hypothetical protein
VIRLWRYDGTEYGPPRVLCCHDSSMHIQQAHPHPRVSPDGKYVLFTSDRSGYCNVYEGGHRRLRHFAPGGCEVRQMSKFKENPRMSKRFCLLAGLTTLVIAVAVFCWSPSVLPPSRAGDPLTPPATKDHPVPQSVELHQGLGSLPYLNRARSRSVCAENPTGAKGKGGMAVPDPSDPSAPASARAADDLGQGWKARPFLRVNKGQTATLMTWTGRE